MPATQYYTATSLDGYIADENNSLDWLFEVDRDADAGEQSFAAFLSDVGAMAMGATTYEWVLEHEKLLEDPAKWHEFYADIPCWVFTHRDLRVVPDASVEFTSDPVETVHARMVEAAGGKNVWLVGGGDLVGQFADAGLLDEVIVYVAPVTLGAGKPLLPRHIELRLEETARNGDFVTVRYSVAR